MIAVQVAAGIIIAYVLIVNQRAVLRSLGWLFVAGAGLLAVSLLGWVASIAIGWAGPGIWKVLAKIANMAVAMTGLGLMAAGGYALVRIYRAIARSKRPDLSKADKRAGVILLGFTFLNFLVIYAISWPVMEWTVIGDWYAAADNWSRAHGWADLASYSIGTIGCLWSVPVAYLIERSRRSVATTVGPAALQIVDIEPKTLDQR